MVSKEFQLDRRLEQKTLTNHRRIGLKPALQRRFDFASFRQAEAVAPDTNLDARHRQGKALWLRRDDENHAWAQSGKVSVRLADGLHAGVVAVGDGVKGLSLLDRVVPGQRAVDCG